MDLNDLMQLDSLDGWQLRTGYWAELKHGLMGTFPALTREDKKPFMCLDIKILANILEKHLTHRRFKINSPLVLASVTEDIAFCLNTMVDMHNLGRVSEPFALVGSDKLMRLKKADDPFLWAPGLIGADRISIKEKNVLLREAIRNAHSA